MATGSGTTGASAMGESATGWRITESGVPGSALESFHSLEYIGGCSCASGVTGRLIDRCVYTDFPAVGGGEVIVDFNSS